MEIILNFSLKVLFIKIIILSLMTAHLVEKATAKKDIMRKEAKR